jgi:hypothetical protein
MIKSNGHCRCTQHLAEFDVIQPPPVAGTAQHSIYVCIAARMCAAWYLSYEVLKKGVEKLEHAAGGTRTKPFGKLRGTLALHITMTLRVESNPAFLRSTMAAHPKGRAAVNAITLPKFMLCIQKTSKRFYSLSAQSDTRQFLQAPRLRDTPTHAVLLQEPQQ